MSEVSGATLPARERDGVYIEESAHGVYKQLTEGSDPISVPFRTMKDVFMWAMVLGCRAGVRRPLEGKRTLIFRWAQFSPQQDIPLLKAAALAGHDDLDTLASQEEILSAAEEYANTGIHELRSLLLSGQGEPLWNLVAHLS